MHLYDHPRISELLAFDSYDFKSSLELKITWEDLIDLLGSKAENNTKMVLLSSGRGEKRDKGLFENLEGSLGHLFSLSSQ